MSQLHNPGLIPYCATFFIFTGLRPPEAKQSHENTKHRPDLLLRSLLHLYRSAIVSLACLVASCIAFIRGTFQF